jgi:hypothetical protein
MRPSETEESVNFSKNVSGVDTPRMERAGAWRRVVFLEESE